MTGKEFQEAVWNSGIKIADLVKQSGIKEPTFYSLYRKRVIDEFYLQKLYKTALKPFLKNFNNNISDNLSVSLVSQENNSNIGMRKNLTVIPIKAFGGFLTGYSNKVYMDSLETVYIPWLKGKQCFAFEVDGYSMFKTFKNDGEISKIGYEPGSYVITTELETPDWLQKGKDYVFVTIDGIIIKRFVKIDDGKIFLDSINKDYKQITLPLKSVKKIFFIEDTGNNNPQ